MPNIKVKILEEVDKNAFNKFVNHSPYGDILQFWQWGDVKRTEGWKPLRVAVIEDKKILLTAQILLKKIPFLGNYAYIPHGPIFHTKENLNKGLTYFNQFLIRQSKNYNFICIEIEPRIGKLVVDEESDSDENKKSSNYIEKVLKKENTKFNDFNSLEEFDKIFNKKLKKIVLNADKEDYEELEIDLKKIKVQKIKSLSLNSGKQIKKSKKNYNKDFYNKPFLEEKNIKTNPENKEQEIKKSKIQEQYSVEIISDQTSNNFNSLVLREETKLDKKSSTPTLSLPIKPVKLEIEENISDLKKENLKINNTFTKSLEDPRIKQKAKERLKEFDTEELKQNQPNKTNTKIKNANNFKLKETKKTPELDENSSIKPLVDPEILQIFQKHGYDLTGRNMQPKHKLYYDLNQPLENLLKLCKKSTRYNISFAKRNGVKVDEFLPDHKLIKLKIQKFYKLLLETQKRAKGYPIRSIETFFNLFKVFRNDDNLSLFEASYNQEAIAINISQRTKHWSSSFYAASNRKYPKLKAPYLLRWESITKAKEYGSSLYDFWGIVPNSENHKGYSNHKLSFGGIRVDNYGILAFPISPIKYSIWDAGIWLRTEGLKKLREIVWKIRKKFVK